MTKVGKRIGWSLLAATGVLLIAASAAAIAQHVGAHAGGGTMAGGAAPQRARGVLLIAASAAAIAQHVGAHAGGGTMAGGAHQHLDGRFSHNQYYYDRG